MPEESEIGEVGVDKVGDEASEHAKHHADKNPWMRFLGLSTAIFAVVAAIASLKSGHYADEALIHSNEATLRQAEASDQWSYYQAKGMKSVVRQSEATTLTALNAPADRIKAANEDARHYMSEQADIKKEADGLVAERVKLEEESLGDLRAHKSFAYVVTTLQVAIGLSAVAALIARRGIWLFALLFGFLGTSYFLYTLIRGY